MRTNLENIPLLSEDILLVQGHHNNLKTLYEESDLHVKKPHNIEAYNLEERLMMVSIPVDSVLVGKTLRESRLGDAYGLGVLGILRHDTTKLLPAPEEKLEGGDTLLVKGKHSSLLMIEGLQNLEVETGSLPN